MRGLCCVQSLRQKDKGKITVRSFPSLTAELIVPAPPASWKRRSTAFAANKADFRVLHCKSHRQNLISTGATNSWAQHRNMFWRHSECSTTLWNQLHLLFLLIRWSTVTVWLGIKGPYTGHHSSTNSLTTCLNIRIQENVRAFSLLPSSNSLSLQRIHDNISFWLHREFLQNEELLAIFNWHIQLNRGIPNKHIKNNICTSVKYLLPN